jgi:transposase, IS5 family
LDIRYSGKALGRPSAKSQTPYRKRKFKEGQGMRNQVEGKFGQGKNGYNLIRVRARAARTSESWIAAIFFVMNLVRFSKEFLFSFLKALLGSLFLFQTFLCNVQMKISHSNYKTSSPNPN